MSKTSARNREIFSALQAGKSLAEVADLHGLTVPRVQAIQREERLKRRYSVEEAYRALRIQSLTRN
jgi:DNA-binding CsgD family transcriptional regulator